MLVDLLAYFSKLRSKVPFPSKMLICWLIFQVPLKAPFPLKSRKIPGHAYGIYVFAFSANGICFCFLFSTCNIGSWHCENDVCEGTCDYFGVGHMYTFDNFMYSFEPAACTYTLMEVRL